ncbi:MAG TPA: 4-(cytidine 5'-diphospho)-2-C-methyl-D-erythritol kinase [Caulobacteraceae bacterium]|jgi:4-diphosphocytidyl-2-C-methyl-D-erythritol kinase
MPASDFAPAKVNLFLHVGRPAADGYHPIASLMVFADIGDRLSLRTAEAMGFRIGGPFAAGLPTEADNLVTRARNALLAEARAGHTAFELLLEKALPIASGLGGGSSDAAAALRLVSSALGLTGEPAARIATTLGSDVPACLAGVAAIATGRGEILAPAPRLPRLDAVLVNPMVPSPTAEVYRAYDLAPDPAGANLPDLPPSLDTAQAAADFLAGCRNDLERPALTLRPLIGEVLARLGDQPETLLRRMSGSGATCFALCADAAAAGSLAKRLADLEPTWWVRRCRLGDAA